MSTRRKQTARKAKASKQKRSETAVTDSVASKQAKTIKSDVTASTALSGQVLRGELLSHVARYLDVQSLVSATATNTAFRQCFISDGVWEGSAYEVPTTIVQRKPKAITPASLLKLQHLVLPISVFQSGPTNLNAKLFLHYLPPLPALLSLSNVEDAAESDLENKFAKLQALSLRRTTLTPTLLTLLQQMQLHSLRLSTFFTH